MKQAKAAATVTPSSTASKPIWGTGGEKEKSKKGGSNGKPDREITTLAENDSVAQRLQHLRGVGPMVATALPATVGDASRFANGRQMAVSSGLTPKQNSSGDKEKLPGHKITVPRHL
ncbi:MAG: transposase [Gallionellaceae bacterium]